ncbi:hypothetical protein, partial [Methanosarcina sp. 2.H.T.1A.15]
HQLNTPLANKHLLQKDLPHTKIKKRKTLTPQVKYLNTLPKQKVKKLNLLTPFGISRFLRWERNLF